VAELSWTAWPVTKSPARAAVAVGFLALLGWALQTTSHTGYFTLLGVLLVWTQIASFFLPTHYTLSDEKVLVAGLVGRKEKAWSEFRSFLADRDGMLLSPFPGRSRLERFRGLSLQFHGNRDEVVAFVQRNIPRPEVSNEHVGDAGQAGRGEAGRA